MNSPTRQQNKSTHVAIERRLRREAETSRTEPMSDIRSRVMHRIVADEAKQSPPPILLQLSARRFAAPALAVAASFVVFAGAWFAQPGAQRAPIDTGGVSLLDRLDQAKASAKEAPERLVETTFVGPLGREYQALRTEADRAANLIKSAFGPIRSALMKQ